MMKVLYVGMDVHKDPIDIALADADPTVEARVFGRIGGDMASLDKAIRKLKSTGCEPCFAYEAGPGGYHVYRHLQSHGLACIVVAPSLIPKRAGDKIKTDRRYSLMLARFFRAGELTSVHVPDEEDEAMRDLIRARNDAKSAETRARQRLLAFLLRCKRQKRSILHLLSFLSWFAPQEGQSWQHQRRSLDPRRRRIGLDILSLGEAVA